MTNEQKGHMDLSLLLCRIERGLRWIKIKIISFSLSHVTFIVQALGEGGSTRSKWDSALTCFLYEHSNGPPATRGCVDSQPAGRGGYLSVLSYAPLSHGVMLGCGAVMSIYDSGSYGYIPLLWWFWDRVGTCNFLSEFVHHMRDMRWLAK